MYDTGIYEILNAKNGCRYVGSALRMASRWRQHIAQLCQGNHHSRYLQRSWNKYGSDCFRFTPVIWCAKCDLIHYEQTVMDALSPEYNVAPIAGSQLGYRHTEETKKKLKAARARNPSSPRKGAVMSEETKAKISKSRKGKGGDKGWTQERRNKISVALKGRVVTEEQRRKISYSLTGRKQSAETIEKRVQKLRGRKAPEGFAEKVRARMLGSKFSQATVDKIRKRKAVLSEDTVLLIRSMISSGKKHKDVHAETGVPIYTIADISCGRKYWWVK